MTAAPESKLGKKVGGRYQIVAHLGGGGFGQTYLAEDQHLPYNPKCVVKHLQPELSDTVSLETAQRLFEAEARVLYQLSDCDRIPRLFAHFEEAKDFYLVQEYIEGRNLSHEYAEGQPQSEQYVMQLLRGILEVLIVVHQRHVIHRDIKPSNLIRRRRDDQLVLIDFGAVKQLGTRVIGVQGNTTRTIAIGSPGYMPNEQSAGRPRFSSDIFAVGMIGIQALTGKHPKKMPEDPHTCEILWREGVTASSALCDILDRMVRYDFRDRYPTAVEALAALDQLMPLQASLLHTPGSRSPSHQHAHTTLAHQVFLDSECGIDYRPLQQLLEAKRWQEADRATYQIMLTICGLKPGMRLSDKKIQELPCRDLRTLDYLWVTYSDGQFGFSLQKQVWSEVGGRTDINYANLQLLGRARRSGWRVNGPIERFGNRVGWRDRSQWLSFNDLLFTIDAPAGHLPAWHLGAIGLSHMVTFFAKLEDCLL
jgi:serine/threonine-protein kinase